MELCARIRSNSDLIKIDLCARLACTRGMPSRGSSPVSGVKTKQSGSSKSINQLKGNRKILF